MSVLVKFEDVCAHQVWKRVNPKDPTKTGVLILSKGDTLHKPAVNVRFFDNKSGTPHGRPFFLMFEELIRLYECLGIRVPPCKKRKRLSFLRYISGTRSGEYVMIVDVEEGFCTLQPWDYQHSCGISESIPSRVPIDGAFWNTFEVVRRK